METKKINKPGFSNVLPFSNEEKRAGLHEGDFVYFKKSTRVMFRDQMNRLVPLEKVIPTTDRWNLDEGKFKGPRLTILDENDQIIQKGDRVLYGYLDSNPDIVIVIGSLQYHQFKTYQKRLNKDLSNPDNWEIDSDLRNNKKRFFLVEEDGNGNLIIFLEGKAGENEEDSGTGNLSIKIKAADTTKNGNLKIDINGKFALVMRNADDVVSGQLEFDNTKDDEKFKYLDKFLNKLEFNKDGSIIETATIRIGKDETVAKILSDLIDQILAMTQATAAGGPTIAAKFNQADFEALKTRITNFMEKQ